MELRHVDFFATSVRFIRQTPDYVRLTFCCDDRAISVVMTLAAYVEMQRRIIEGPLLTMH